jgi:hypothetical protein
MYNCAYVFSDCRKCRDGCQVFSKAAVFKVSFSASGQPSKLLVMKKRYVRSANLGLHLKMQLLAKYVLLRDIMFSFCSSGKEDRGLESPTG